MYISLYVCKYLCIYVYIYIYINDMHVLITTYTYYTQMTSYKYYTLHVIIFEAVTNHDHLHVLMTKYTH